MPERTSPVDDASGSHAKWSWDTNQPGFKFTSAEPGTPAFYEDVEQHQYALEPHIRDVVRFERFQGRDVLEAGCGIGTDGVQFARAGARYTVSDFSEVGLSLARRRFELEGLPGSFVHGSITALPFPDESFDVVYSHGVIHHVEDTERAVAEFRRVLRPGGTVLAMVYHRGSLNYRFSSNARLETACTRPSGARGLAFGVARLTGEDEEIPSPAIARCSRGTG